MAALIPEIRVGAVPTDQVPLELASDGILRCVWEGRFGPMLIEVLGGVAYVNGARVKSAEEVKSDGSPVSEGPSCAPRDKIDV